MKSQRASNTIHLGAIDWWSVLRRLTSGFNSCRPNAGRKLKGCRRDLKPISEPNPEMKASVPDKPKKTGSRRWVAAAVLGLVGLAMLWQGFAGSGPLESQRTQASIASPRQVAAKYDTKRIKDFRGFEWVLARNPEVSDADRAEFGEIDYRQWRWMQLRMPEGDGRLEVGLGRPLEWLEVNRVRVRGTVRLDLPELGAVGEAEVLSVEPCPDPGPKPSPDHRLVTGTFKHTAGNIIDVHVEGLDKPIGCTSNHPFWSEDRKAFIEAGDLREGEALRTADGSVTSVTSIDKHEAAETVYNLEIDVEHVYYVSTAGVLVHNAYFPRTAQEMDELLGFEGTRKLMCKLELLCLVVEESIGTSPPRRET
jgi:hypothetical protein